MFAKRTTEHIKKSKTLEKLQQVDLDYSELIDLLIYSHIQGYEISKKYLNLKEFSNEEDELSIIREDFIESIKQFKNRYPKLYKEIEKKEKEHYFWIKKSNDLEITKKIQQEIIKGIEKGLDGYTIITNIGDLGDEYLVGSKENSNYWKMAIRQNIANAQATGNYTNLLEYQARGIKYAKFDAVMDGRTTSTCSSLHGRIMKIEDFALNGLVPPLHFGCRSALRPVNTNMVEDENGELRKHIKETTNEEIKHFKKHVQKGFGNPLNTVENVKKLVEDKEKMMYNSSIEISEKISKLEKDEIFEKIENKIKKVNEIMENKIKYNPIVKMNEQQSDKEIVKRIGGLDKTNGSCSSVAFVYIGNKAGYEVYDFRGGASQEFFSNSLNIKLISQLKNVKTAEFKEYNDLVAINKIFNEMQEGKEYYLAIGQHASIVKKINNKFHYLELQNSEDKNGYKTFSTTKELIKRFGLQKSYTYYGNKYEVSSFLIDVDTLKNNGNFIKLLGYINTHKLKQIKGVGGSVK